MSISKEDIRIHRVGLSVSIASTLLLSHPLPLDLLASSNILLLYFAGPPWQLNSSSCFHLLRAQTSRNFWFSSVAAILGSLDKILKSLLIVSWNDLTSSCAFKLLESLCAAEPCRVVTSEPSLWDTVSPL